MSFQQQPPYGQQPHPQQGHPQQGFPPQQGHPQQMPPPGQPQQFYPPPPPGAPPPMHQQQHPQHPQQTPPQQQQPFHQPTPQQQQHPHQPPPQQQQQQQHPQQTPPQQQQQFAHPPPQAQAAPLPQQHGVPPTDSGGFPGGTYTVTHRDTNAVLNINLQPGANVRSKSGAMIHMSATVQLTGKLKFSLKKMVTGSDLSESTYTGPGRVVLGPTLFGDIITLHIDGRQNWMVGKDAFLACTPDIKRETKAQGFSKTLFSGEDLFIYRIVGQGLLWLTSFGAVDRLDLQPGEQHIVDNGHLVAWSCDYRIERAGGAGGGLTNSLKSGEGLVCRFTGPGSVYIQTRNRDEFDSYIKGFASSGGGGYGIL